MPQTKSHDPEDEIIYTCSYCGSRLDEEQSRNNKNEIYIKCNYCSANLDRLSDVESQFEELQKRLTFLIEKYNKNGETNDPENKNSN